MKKIEAVIDPTALVAIKFPLRKCIYCVVSKIERSRSRSEALVQRPSSLIGGELFIKEGVRAEFGARRKAGDGQRDEGKNVHRMLFNRLAPIALLNAIIALSWRILTLTAIAGATFTPLRP
jgi:hypothetical protein